jgi:RNA polymerase sigma-70 factor, ECF subfamily
MVERAKDASIARLEALCRSGDYAAAATSMINAHGGEILAFLQARLRSDADGWDAFGMLCEEAWLALPAFEFRCSPRSWLYVLARHVESRFGTAQRRKLGAHVPLSDAAHELTMPFRTATAPYQRTDVQDRFRGLRERLSPEDELILLLRVDRRLRWEEIAHVFQEPGVAAPGAVQLAREAARLRKRFQSIKNQLRHWAVSEGLLEATSRD